MDHVTLGMCGIPVLEKYQYIIFKTYDIIILLNSVFQNAPVGGSTSPIVAQPVNVTTEQHDGSNRVLYHDGRLTNSEL